MLKHLSAPAVADADRHLPVPASSHDWLAARRFARDEGLPRGGAGRCDLRVGVLGMSPVVVWTTFFDCFRSSLRQLRPGRRVNPRCGVQAGAGRFSLAFHPCPGGRCSATARSLPASSHRCRLSWVDALEGDGVSYYAQTAQNPLGYGRKNAGSYSTGSTEPRRHSYTLISSPSDPLVAILRSILREG